LHIIMSIHYSTWNFSYLEHEVIFFWRNGKFVVAEGHGVSSKNCLKN
jgi:hypothetical protein